MEPTIRVLNEMVTDPVIEQFLAAKALRPPALGPLLPRLSADFRRKDDPLKKALVTGITGQDGSYLTELLLEEGYRRT